jgi:hypothetical protein
MSETADYESDPRWQAAHHLIYFADELPNASDQLVRVVCAAIVKYLVSCGVSAEITDFITQIPDRVDEDCAARAGLLAISLDARQAKAEQAGAS